MDPATLNQYQTDFTPPPVPPPLHENFEESSSDSSVISDDEKENEDENGKVDEVEKVNETISQDQSDQQEIPVLHISTINSEGDVNSGKVSTRRRVPPKILPTIYDPSDTDSEASTEIKETGINSIGLISDVLAKFINGPGASKAGSGDPITHTPDSSGPGNAIQHPFIEFLFSTLATLSSENAELRKKLGEAHASVNLEVDSGPSSHSINQGSKTLQQSDTTENPVSVNVNLVHCTGSSNNFLDVPQMFKGDSRSDHLRGRRGIEVPITYMDLNPHIAFLVVAEYNCFCRSGPNYFRLVGYKDGKMVNDSPLAEKVRISIFLGKSVKQALMTIIKENPARFHGFSNTFMHTQFHPPYYMFYVHTRTFNELVDSTDLPDSVKEGIRRLCLWFEENCREDWDEADELLSKGKINFKHCRMLFRPEELVVEPRKDDEFLIWAYKTKKYPWNNPFDQSVDLEQWDFNGCFRKLPNVIFHHGPASAVPEKDGERDITSLNRYPLRFAKEGLREKLIARGNKFWKYRKPTLATLSGEHGGESAAIQDTREHRYMIDYKIFRSMHPFKPMFDDQTDDLGTEAMAKNEPPDDDFLAMMPPRIHAFDLANKAWKHVRVDHLTNVTWNKESFSRLVIPGDTKELIQAAITSHGHHPSAAPDIVSDKGQGLLILLHGGPGTGKTLTAESIAEEQERPLYRVTCGDIGVEPVEVEKYLRSVLVIGKAWGCVVLLDEADVFLEERSTNDPKQNAIVSKYYDGIMILTTNRVGTFDEAFKSRIHLAIRYSDLDEDQRVEIWRNFIHLLARSKERVDIDDLNLNVNKVARYSLNGRQIRNVITLARYLARFRKEMLVYKHVQDALASVVKFDKYLEEVRGSDELFARQERIR